MKYWHKHKFPTVFVVCFFMVVVVYYFTYYFPFTNNAFVVANTRPVAANVKGYITDIYVKNEEYVKKGQPLFTVFKTPYELAYKKAEADVAEAVATLMALEAGIKKTQRLVTVQQELLAKAAFDYDRYHAALRDHAVSAVEVNNLFREKNAAGANLKALEEELVQQQHSITAQHMKIKSLEAVMANAKVDVDETTVYAKNNGIVHNMFTALGAPIEIRKPIFSFVNMEQLFIQANFNETDLRNVRAGDKVTIMPRIYFWRKTYHGRVISTNWATNRQVTDPRTQEQVVTNNENNWFLLPQRFPIQITITDYDPVNYPLSIGASAYVYIHT